MKTFEITAMKYNGEEETIKVESSSIMGALEKAHKTFQLECDLQPSQYKLVGAYHVYYGMSIEDIIKSEYPIPGGPNPVLEKKVKPELTSGKTR